MAISELFLKKLIDECYSVARRFVTEHGGKMLSTSPDSEQAISYHLQKVDSWSSEVSFSDLKRPKLVHEVFIELELYVRPQRLRLNARESNPSIPLRRLFEETSQHVILLGHPGAGKTTSMKHFCQLMLHDDTFQGDTLSFPLLIRFRELNAPAERGRGVILREVQNVLGLQFELHSRTEDDETSQPSSLRERTIVQMLEHLKVLLILDGFDELASGPNREIAIGEIRELCHQLRGSKIVLTSRTGDFAYSIDRTSAYEIAALTSSQIDSFAEKWLGSTDRAADFSARVRASPFADTAIRPLALAHLCVIYERIGTIPEKPKTVYKKIVNLLLEEWDQQRSVKRRSRYAQFEVDRKFEFLSHLAYILTTELGRTVFSKTDLRNVYQQICADYGLLENETSQVVAELESHTGLVVQSGYDFFEFAHKSLQEYLAAEYLVRLPSIPTASSVLSRVPNEAAIAVAISSSPGEYLSELVTARLEGFRRSLKNASSGIDRSAIAYYHGGHARR